jgi:hypothetical protein
VASIQNPGAEDGVREKKRSRLGSFTYLLRACERDFAGVPYMFCSLLLGKRILLGFLGFCFGTFPMLRVLLPEVAGVAPFRVCE